MTSISESLSESLSGSLAELLAMDASLIAADIRNATPALNMGQIMHCLSQIQRFTKVMHTGQMDAFDRPLQLGFNYGRLAVMLQPTVPTFASIFPTCDMTFWEIRQYLITPPDLNHPVHQIIYGCCLGIVQEALGESYQKWWRPLAEHYRLNGWHGVQTYVTPLAKAILMSNGKNYAVMWPQDNYDWSALVAKLQPILPGH